MSDNFETVRVTKQAMIVTDQAEIVTSRFAEKIAFFNEDGTPFDFGTGGGGGADVGTIEIPTPPATGTYILQSVEGVVSWVEPTP